MAKSARYRARYNYYFQALTSRFGVSIAMLFAASCGAPPTSNGTPNRQLTALEIHTFQTSTMLEVSRIIEDVGEGDRYAIPRAPYVRLGEIGRGTPTSYYQAWITFSPAVQTTQYSETPIPVDARLAASVSFNEPTGSYITPPPSPSGESWVRSDVGIPEFPATELWLDTTECENDRPPQPKEDRFGVRLSAVWSVADTPIELSCRASLNTPNGKHYMSCFGGSGPTPSGLKYGLYGGGSLEKGCRAALEELARSYAPLPLIVSEWRVD